MLLKIFISGHTPQNVETKLKLGPFHSTTLTRLTQTKGLTAGVACRPPPPFARVGEGLSRNTPTGAKLALIFRGARERRGQRPPSIPASGGGAVQEHAYGRKTSPNISWSPRAEGAAAPFHPRLKGGTPPLQDPPELHVLEQGRAGKGPLFGGRACNLAIGANGECFRPSLCLEWLPQVQGPKMTSKLVYGV